MGSPFAESILFRNRETSIYSVELAPKAEAHTGVSSLEEASSVCPKLTTVLIYINAGTLNCPALARFAEFEKQGASHSSNYHIFCPLLNINYSRILLRLSLKDCLNKRHIHITLKAAENHSQNSIRLLNRHLQTWESLESSARKETYGTAS